MLVKRPCLNMMFGFVNLPIVSRLESICQRSALRSQMNLVIVLELGLILHNAEYRNILYYPGLNFDLGGNNINFILGKIIQSSVIPF